MKELHSSRTKALSYILYWMFGRKGALGKGVEDFKLSFLIRNVRHNFSLRKLDDKHNPQWEVKEE